MRAYDKIIQAQRILFSEEVTEEQRVALIKQMIDATMAIYDGSQFDSQ